MPYMLIVLYNVTDIYAVCGDRHRALATNFYYVDNMRLALKDFALWPVLLPLCSYCEPSMVIQYMWAL